MATLGISFTDSAGRIGNYLTGGQAHDGSGERRYVLASGVGTTPETFARDAAITRTAHGKQGAKRQAASLYLSFTAEELDPDDPEAAEKALAYGLSFFEEAFPGHQSIAVVQKDGASGLWHVHGAVIAQSHREAVFEHTPAKTGKPVRQERSAGRAITAEMSNVYRLRALNDQMIEQHFGYSNKELIEGRRRAANVTAFDLRKREHEAYNWRDDLRERIDLSAAQGGTVTDFQARLAAEGVEARERGQEGALSYAFTDADGKKRNARAKGKMGLGEAYGREGVELTLGRARAARGKAAKPVRQPAPVSTDPMPCFETLLAEQRASMPPARVELAPAPVTGRTGALAAVDEFMAEFEPVAEQPETPQEAVEEPQEGAGAAEAAERAQEAAQEPEVSDFLAEVEEAAEGLREATPAPTPVEPPKPVLASRAEGLLAADAELRTGRVEWGQFSE